MNSKRLSVRTKLGYGVCDLGGNLFFTAMGFWSLNYLTDTAALSAAAAGFAVMIGKFWDAVTDPMMGFISDRTRSRWGRRRPYLLFGAIPLGLTMWYFFTNPHIASQTALTAWAALALCALNTAYTIVNIPYSSLTPELTDDYNERTSLNGFRFAFAIVGTICGAAIVLPIVGAFPDKSTGFSAAGLVMGALMVVTALVTFFSVRERPHSREEIPTGGFFKTYSVVFSNKPYIILILVYAANIIAINFLQGILVYYFKYVFDAESRTTIAMVVLLVVAMIFVPIAVPISKRIGKRLTYQIGLGVIALACLVIGLAGEALGLGFVYGMMLFAGSGLGLTFVAPWSMVPDVVEWDAVRTGERKEGVYYGMWTFFSKCGQALSIGLSGFILGMSGYVADAAQTPATLFAIKCLIGPLPALVFVVGIVILSRYPITEKTYNEMMGRGKQPADE